MERRVFGGRRGESPGGEDREMEEGPEGEDRVDGVEDDRKGD